MSQEELMIGDWFRFRFTIDGEETVCTFRIALPRRDRGYIWGECGTGRQCMCTPERLEPIPLTEEILQKNGFFYKNGVWMWLESRGKIHVRHLANKWSIEVKNELAKKDEFDRADIVSYCRCWTEQLYVHELQHALKLCRLNKEIVM